VSFDGIKSSQGSFEIANTHRATRLQNVSSSVLKLILISSIMSWRKAITILSTWISGFSCLSVSSKESEITFEEYPY